MSNVIPLKPDFVGPGARVEPKAVLDGAAEADLQDVVVVGFRKDADGSIYLASSEGPGDTLWLLEAAKKHLLNGCRED